MENVWFSECLSSPAFSEGIQSPAPWAILVWVPCLTAALLRKQAEAFWASSNSSPTTLLLVRKSQDVRSNLNSVIDST